MVSNAVNTIKPDVIRRSFETCGIAPFGQKVSLEHLNGCLRGVLGYREGIEELEGDFDNLESADGASDEELDMLQEAI